MKLADLMLHTYPFLTCLMYPMQPEVNPCFFLFFIYVHTYSLINDFFDESLFFNKHISPLFNLNFGKFSFILFHTAHYLKLEIAKFLLKPVKTEKF